MKNKRFIISILSTVVIGLTLYFVGCGLSDSTPTRMNNAGSMMFHSPYDPKPTTTKPQDRSKKWQQMIDTNIDALQVGSSKIDKSIVNVVSFYPMGQVRSVSEVDEINITFSEPVAPLKKVEKGAPSLITVQPAVKGEGYWKSSTTYAFRIDTPLKQATRYDIAFKGYTAFSGKKINEKKWSVTTPVIQLLTSQPYQNKKWQTLNQKILVHFSQDVDRKTIKDFISIATPQGDHPFTIGYSTKEERKLLDYYIEDEEKKVRQYITITPFIDLPIASDIYVKFKPGLPSMEGPVGLPAERRISFRTYEIFDVVYVDSQFNPDAGLVLEFTNPVYINKVIEKVSFQPKVTVTKEYSDWSTHRMALNGHFAPGTTYTITIPADLQDQFGNKPGTQKQFKSKCLDYTPLLNPPYYDHFVLENFLEKKIPLEVRNISKSLVSFKKLEKEDIRKLFKGDSEYAYFELKDWKTLSTSTYQWNIPTKKNRGYVMGFDLESCGIKQPGFYFLHFGSTTRDYYYGHIFQLTDIAAVAKFSPSQVFMIPFNMKTGEIIPNQEFAIDNSSNTGNTGIHENFKAGADGIGLFNPSETQLKSNRLLDCFVFSEPHQSFVWGKKDQMIDMWNFEYNSGVSYNYSPNYYYNHLLAFTDKYLYKAGQTVKFKGILRQVTAGIMKIPTVKTISVEVFNSRSQSIKKMTLQGSKVTPFGSFADEFVLPDTAPTGFYNIKFVVNMTDQTYETSSYFSVQEYKPSKFEVKVAIDQKNPVSGQPISGTVSSKYLFGTPMSKAGGNCVWTTQQSYFTPQGYDGYTFGTYDSQYTGKTVYKKDFQLDENGVFTFGDKSFTHDCKNSITLSVYGEVKDKDNNRIASSNSILVHRGQYYIGVKTDSYFFKQDKPGKIMLVSVNPAGTLVEDTAVTLDIKREEWKSFQQKDASGALRWNWEKITENVTKETVKLRDGKFDKDYKFAKPGFYTISATGKDELNNTIETTGYFYVTGSGYVCWGVNEGRVIDLQLDKKSYKPGETMELLIKSPFETSTAIITVEREKVMWWKTVRMQGNADTIKIPVTKDFMPNVYINVLILKERTGLTFDNRGSDTGKPEFYSGYKGVPINASENKLKIEIKANQESFEPGNEVKLDIKVTDSTGAPVKSEVCLSVVDKGVLNLVNYQLPDPFEFFWANRPLDVKTVSTLNDVLGRRQFKEKGENPGGDGGGSAFGSVVVRKNFKENAYYSAFVQTDAKGMAKVTFKLPDNLTTFKAMTAVCTTDHKFGRESRDILVKKNIILSPAVPNFSRPGDKYSAGVTVTNNSNQKLKIAVDVQYKNVLRTKGDPDVKNITLEAGDTQPVWFQFEVNGTKTQQLTFRAVGGKFQDGLYLEVPVRLPLFVEAAANFGRVETQPVKEQIIVPGGTLEEANKAEITLSSSAMVGVKRNFDILQEYPYECLEQRLSKEYPLLEAGDFLLEYGLLSMDKKEINTRIETLLKQMPTFQDGSGGFKYWPDCIHPCPYLTCYAVEFILDARAKGYAFDKSMLSRAEEYLKGIARRTIDPKYPYSKNIYYLIQSYAVYALSKDNIFMKDAVNNMFEVRDQIPFSGMAYLVKALDVKNDLPAYMQPVIAKTMLNKMKDAPTMTHFENNETDTWWWVLESNVKTTSIVLEAFLEVYGKFPYAEKIARWLASTTTQKRAMSTQEHIRLFRAFEKYYKVFESEVPDFIAEVLFNGSSKIKETFKDRQLTARTFAVNLNQYKPGQTIDTLIKKEGTGILYYLLRLRYYPMGQVDAIDRGFNVEKTYKTLDGNILKDNTFNAGEKYIVEIKVSTTMERSFVMLDDPLPAGLRVLNPNFESTSGLDTRKVSQDSEWGGYWGRFYRSEIYFDRVLVFADYLTRGTHKWKYLAIATNSGSFVVPNTVAQEMYNPEVFGRNSNRNVEVK